MRPDQVRWMARIEASTSSERPERTTTSSIVVSNWTFYRSLSDPTSQCSVLSTNCGFPAAYGAFIPIGSRSFPVTWAENIAASPNTATRPFPAKHGARGEPHRREIGVARRTAMRRQACGRARGAA